MAREPFAARLTCIWIGALFFFMIRGFSGKFSDQLRKEKESKNLWTGYLITLLALVAVIYFVFVKPSMD